MSSESGTTRRTFVIAMATIGAGGALFMLLRRFLPGGGADEMLIAMTGVAGDPRSARGIGRAYLESPGVAVDEVLLTESLFADAQWQTATAKEAPALLRAKVSEDFAAGRTLVLNGWTLSETEVRLCALVELLARDGRLS